MPLELCVLAAIDLSYPNVVSVQNVRVIANIHRVKLDFPPMPGFVASFHIFEFERSQPSAWVFGAIGVVRTNANRFGISSRMVLMMGFPSSSYTFLSYR